MGTKLLITVHFHIDPVDDRTTHSGASISKRWPILTFKFILETDTALELWIEIFAVFGLFPFVLSFFRDASLCYERNRFDGCQCSLPKVIGFIISIIFTYLIDDFH